MKLANLDSFKSMEELVRFVEQVDKEQKEWRARCQCCANCTQYYEEYGWSLCKIHDDALEVPSEQKCEDWT